MLRRKVYTGGSSPMLSLPRSWVEAHGLGSGGYVVLDVQEDCIVVEPQDMRRGSGEFVIESSGMSEGELHRRVIAAYLAGYSRISIRFDRQSIRLKDSARELLNFLVAVEIVKDLGYEVTAQVLLSHSKLPVIKTVERISVLVEGMLGDLLRGLAERDAELIRHVAEREQEVDRLYFLAVRQLKSAAASAAEARQMGIQHRRDVLGMRLIVKSLERIADHAEAISRNIAELPEGCELLLGAAEQAAEMYGVARDACLSFDVALAEKVFRKLPEVERAVSEGSRRLIGSSTCTESLITLRLSLESCYRIARYCCDMAEIVINMHAEVPERETGATQV
ncbi:MAG: phosphate uptake regulator PhoU [Euryarchaeota archaeon]|nr:phosphate uptake regulator PhoU [Euryarchaeota archaeon]